MNSIVYTQEFIGRFSEKETIHLRSEGLQEFSIPFEGVRKNASKNLLDNNRNVSRNCKTFITCSNFVKSIRFRLYNDFVQSREKFSVKSLAGNHLSDYICVRNVDFNETFSNAKQAGLLILEITFSIQITEEKLTSEFSTKHYLSWKPPSDYFVF